MQSEIVCEETESQACDLDCFLAPCISNWGFSYVSVGYPTAYPAAAPAYNPSLYPTNSPSYAPGKQQVGAAAKRVDVGFHL